VNFNIKATAIGIAFLAVMLVLVYLLMGTDHRSTTSSRKASNTRVEQPNPPVQPPSPFSSNPAATPQAPGATGSQPPGLPMNNASMESYKRGKKFFQAGNFNEAALAFEQALKENPNNPIFYIALATSYEKMEQWEKGYVVLKRYMEMTLGSMEAYEQR